MYENCRLVFSGDGDDYPCPFREKQKNTEYTNVISKTPFPNLVGGGGNTLPD